MPDTRNSNTATPWVDPLRAFVRSHLASHPNIEDVRPALEAMGHSRPLIEAVYEAEKAARASVQEKAREVARYTKIGEPPAALPELPQTADGLAEAMRLCLPPWELAGTS